MEMSVRRCSSTQGQGPGERFMPEMQALVNPCPLVHQALTRAPFADFLTIHTDLDAALARQTNADIDTSSRGGKWLLSSAVVEVAPTNVTTKQLLAQGCQQ